jgi:hypothetical protein
VFIRLNLRLTGIRFLFLVEDRTGNGQHGNGAWRLAGETLRQIDGAIEVLLSEGQ